MKIGILTFHRAHNYGAVLQCYALQETLNALGHDVDVINYIQPAIESTYRDRRSFSLRHFFEKLPFASFSYAYKAFKQDLSVILHGSQRKRVFNHFVDNRLHKTEPCSIHNLPQNYDAYVIGSDMLWDDVCTGGRFDDVFLGNFPHKTDAKILGYAISGTARSFNLLGSQYSYKHLSNFSNVSLREQVFADIVLKHTGFSFPVCLDPTLLADSAIWEPLLNPKWSEKRYIVTYYIRVKEQDKEIINGKAHKFAKELGCEVVNLDATADAMTVEDFVSIIRYARYMITDSFHGIIFSLLFHRCFNALVFHDSGDSRYVSLLTSLGLAKACVEKDFNPALWNINYNSIDERLSLLRAPSLMYLKSSL